MTPRRRIAGQRSGGIISRHVSPLPEASLARSREASLARSRGFSIVMVALRAWIGDPVGVSDSRDAQPGAPGAAPRPAATAPKPPAVSVNRPAFATGARSPRPPLVQNSRAPTPRIAQTPVAPQVGKSAAPQAPQIAQTPVAPQVGKSAAPQAPQIRRHRWLRSREVGRAGGAAGRESRPRPAAAGREVDAATGRHEGSEPPECGWDDATQLPSSAVIPAADQARAASPVVPSTKAPPPASAPVAANVPAPVAPPEPLASKAPAAPATVALPAPEPVTPPRAGSSRTLRPSLAASVRLPNLEPELSAPATTAAPAPQPTEVAARIEGLSQEMQEQLFGVLCAALDASFLPLLEKQRELEARLDRLDQAEQRAATPAVATPAAPSFTPAPAQVSPKILPLETTQAGPRSVAPRASLIPTSYGFVIEPEAAARRPSIEVALENVGPIDVPTSAAAAAPWAMCSSRSFWQAWSPR